MNRGVALLLSLVAAGALVSASGATTGASAAAGVRLKTISARVHAKGASLVIEATEPVPYIASRPDPLTVLLEFRNVTADGVANAVAASAKSPIAAVAIEPAESTDAPGSRVRITLVQPVGHRVRSNRNTIVVEFDRAPDKAASSARDVSTGNGTPEAILALTGPPALDPIAALGLSPPAAATLAGASTAARASGSAKAFQQPAQTRPIVAGQPTAGGKFSGHPISLDFQGADLRAVLRTFAEISALNIVIDPAVTGSVDVALRDVPWDQALDIILRANKLGYIVDGTIVRIAPLGVLADEEKQRSDLTKAQADAGTITTITKQLSYSKGEEMVTLLKAAQVLSNRGTAFVDTRTNTLIISDLAERLGGVTDLVSTLDKPQPQVEIEARIVQTDKTYARALGIQWGFGGRVDPALGNTTNLAFPNSINVAGAAAAAPGVPAGTAVSLGAGGTSGIGLALGSVNGAFNLDVALSALESSGNARLLSTPRVSTQNNVEAEIAQGVQVPFQVSANNTVTTVFKDAALTLKVTPQITAAGTVILKILVDNGSLGPVTPRGEPTINTQRASTTVLVNDGQTTVLGGIYSSSETSTNDRTPGLGTIPFLRWLFKRDRSQDDSRELLIFITPRIIKR